MGGSSNNEVVIPNPPIASKKPKVHRSKDLSSPKKRKYSTCTNKNINVALVNFIKTTPLLKPILNIEDELLAPIVYNEHILDEIQNLRFVLSRVKDSNLVKLWLISKLEQDKIIINAKINERADKLLKKIEKIENETIIREFKEDICGFRWPVITSRYYNKIKEDMSKSKPVFEFNETSLETNLIYKKNLNSLCTGCYIITFQNKYYYYIGSSTNLRDRMKTHTTNINSFLSNRNSSLSEFFKFYLNFCKKQKSKSNDSLNFNIKILYLSTNYLNLFRLIYPHYRLSKGEWLLLSKITDFFIKILEASLIIKFHPKLNSTNKVVLKYFEWSDEFLQIYSKNNKAGEYLKSKKYKICILRREKSFLDKILDLELRKSVNTPEGWFDERKEF